jgi:hypothetical protein
MSRDTLYLALLPWTLAEKLRRGKPVDGGCGHQQVTPNATVRLPLTEFRSCAKLAREILLWLKNAYACSAAL